jgi:hypothetical protein
MSRWHGLKKAISFLETANYAETTYVLSEKCFRANLFPETLNSLSASDQSGASSSPEELMALDHRLIDESWMPMRCSSLQGKSAFHSC